MLVAVSGNDLARLSITVIEIAELILEHLV
jgi:hypothetical protein